MSILQYLKPVEKKRCSEKTRDGLPDPTGSLASSVPSLAIESANEQVLLASQPTKKTRGSYHKLSPEMRARIGKYACDNGIAAAARRFSRAEAIGHGKSRLNESTVRGLKKAYLTELSRKRKEREELTITELHHAKRGRPLALGDRIDDMVQQYLIKLRECGGVVNTAITIAGARGIVLQMDRSRLAENGGHVNLTRSWAKSLLIRMGFVKRRGTTKASRVAPGEFEQIKKSFLADINTHVQLEEIPPELILNWDQTGIHLVPVSSWTMEKEGSKRVAITGINDKKQITAVFCANAIGEFLPIQLIYAGKTDRCHPKFSFPSDWSITNTVNHWSTETTMIKYLEDVIVPFVVKTRENLGVSQSQPALAIFDHFKGQLTTSITSILEQNNIQSVLIPPTCTDRLQPMDVSVNRAAKSFLEREFQEWYAKEVQTSMRNEEELRPVNLNSAEMKHLGARWLVKMFDHITDNPHLIVNGFIESGITESISKATQQRCVVDDEDEYYYSSADDDSEAVFSD